MSMNEKKLNQIGVGLIVLFGLPAIGYMYGDWKLALTILIVSQLIIGFAKISKNI